MPAAAAAAAAVCAARRVMRRHAHMGSSAALPARAGHSLQPHLRRRALALLPGRNNQCMYICRAETEATCSHACGAALPCPLVQATARNGTSAVSSTTMCITETCGVQRSLWLATARCWLLAAMHMYFGCN